MWLRCKNWPFCTSQILDQLDPYKTEVHQLNRSRHMARLGTVIIATMALTTTPNSAYASPKRGEVLTVVASHYGDGDGFHGKRTANCSVFSKKARTAAHKTLRFGTKVKLCNPKNGICETVSITDRGPFKRHRDIDVASGVGKRLGIGGDTKLTMQIVAVPERPIMGRSCRS